MTRKLLSFHVDKRMIKFKYKNRKTSTLFLRINNIKSYLQRKQVFASMIRWTFFEINISRRHSVWGYQREEPWFDSSLNDQSSTEQHWRDIFRMGQDTFRDNEKVVPPTLEKRDAHFQGVIPIEKQVVIALWRLATGKSFCSTAAKAFCFVSLANFFCAFFSLTALYLNLIQDGSFWGCSRKGPLSEICHTQLYLT